jgi:glycosyltransferase involved in cell wall biosynthesis
LRETSYTVSVLEGFRVAVVVPAFNEEALIRKVLATMPQFVDRVVVVDDASTDGTAAVLRAASSDRVKVLRHRENRGVGAAIVTGYREALAAGADVIAVMAGDAQMHPDDLERLVRPVVARTADYAKGDRLHHPEVWRIMPAARLMAGHVLSWMTRTAAGLPALSDSQCGYTAISSKALEAIDLDALWPRFGYPNDLLGQLAAAGLTVADVPVRPLYGDEKSGIRPWHVAVICGLLLRVVMRRGRGALRRLSEYPAAAPRS